MGKKQRRVAIMLDLVWLYKRHTGIFAGTQRYAEAQGWHSIIDEFAHETLSASVKKSIPYDGIIARANRALATQARRLGVPLVNVWPSSPARHLAPCVFPDSAAIGRMCAEHLISRGLRSFATLTSPFNVEHKLEMKEFARVVREAGFPCAAAMAPQSPEQDIAHWRKNERIIEHWMARWQLPVGVYVGNEDRGRMIVQTCQRRGWRVPADVAIIAGKNEGSLCEHPRPSLTSVEVGYDRIGFEAARLLHGLMERKKLPPEPIRLPPQSLVVRESTDFFAVDDKLVADALEFISAHSHRSIGRLDVARAVGAEIRTLQNRFRKVLDRPIATEIRRVRIERAKRELAQSKRPLAQIARDVGFGDIQRLYEVFRRELGVSPGEYRKQRQVESGM